MLKYKTSKLFEKNVKKLKGKQLFNLLKKIEEICSDENLDRYKNLKNELEKYKRVHVNNSFVILFFEKNKIVHFVDYEHHDTIYKIDKTKLKKYSAMSFE